MVVTIEPPVFLGDEKIGARIIDNVLVTKEGCEILSRFPKQELIWASPRELLNIFQAEATGCHIITVANDVLKKLDLVGKDLEEYSLETVQMFHRDATTAGYRL